MATTGRPGHRRRHREGATYPYAADKLASEHYLDFYRRQHGLEPVVFRFFNVYGPRQDPSSPYSGVISIFTERAQRGGRLRCSAMGSRRGISSM